jgi:hypothetical protein
MGPIIGAFLYLPLAKKIQPETEKTSENGDAKKKVKTKRKKISDKDKRD